MRALDLYWKTNPEWYDYANEEEYDDEFAEPYLTDKAPEEARESFNRYMKQIKEMRKREES